jgi:hypothetical protein
MHSIEPYYNWHNLYLASEDKWSPFFAQEYSEFEFTNTIYNYVIHPQWDNMGSPTLFIKILYTDYDEGYTFIEMMGEWNDCLNNDIMFFKRNIVDAIRKRGVNRFILIGENVLNFHSSDECYYQEWQEDLDGGWILLLNFKEHVIREFEQCGIAPYLYGSNVCFDFPWRTYRPLQLFQKLVKDNHLLKEGGSFTSPAL